jgi:hypothetical protein
MAIAKGPASDKNATLHQSLFARAGATTDIRICKEVSDFLDRGNINTSSNSTTLRLSERVAFLNRPPFGAGQII